MLTKKYYQVGYLKTIITLPPQRPDPKVNAVPLARTTVAAHTMHGVVEVIFATCTEDIHPI